MITFQLREFAIPFFQHTLVIPAQDITVDENTDWYKYLQFEGCDHVVLRLLSIGFGCIDKDTFEYYVDAGKVQVQPEYDEITVEIRDKENGVVYERFTHRQDVTP